MELSNNRKIENVLDFVCDYYEIKDKEVLTQKCRNSTLVKVRYIFYGICVNMFNNKYNISYDTISARLDQNHSSINHALKRVSNEFDLKNEFETLFELYKQHYLSLTLNDAVKKSVRPQVVDKAINCCGFSAPLKNNWRKNK